MLRRPWLDPKILVFITALTISTLDLGGWGGSFDSGRGSLKCSCNVAVVLSTYFFRQPFALLVLNFEKSNVGNVILNQICINAGAVAFCMGVVVFRRHLKPALTYKYITLTILYIFAMVFVLERIGIHMFTSRSDERRHSLRLCHRCAHLSYHSF